MSSQGFGSALFALQGGRPTLREARVVLDAMVHDSLSAHAGGLSTLVNSMDESERADWCGALLRMLFRDAAPHALDGTPSTAVATWALHLHADLAAVHPSWEQHLVLQPSGGVRLSEGAARIVAAIEALWGVPLRFLRRDARR